MLEVLDTGLFFKTKLILVFSFTFCALCLALIYAFLLQSLQWHSVLSLGVVVSVALFMGYALATSALDPTEKRVDALRTFSKETLHELGMPLNTIKTNISMLMKEHNSEKTRKRLDRIDKACDMILKRYEELEYYIKTETFEVLKEKIELHTLVNERIDLIKSCYKNINILTDLETLVVNVDKIGFEKAIDNVLNNAVKYSSEPVRIEISLHATLLKIRDEGIGMDEMELLNIFDKYYQSNAQMPGFGLGLYMVKQYCDTQGIGLFVESKKHSGTTVIFDFKGVA